MSYKAYVVEIKELRKHSNADRLQIATVFGNDVIVGLDIKVGDKMIYFPTDGQLNYEFALENNLLRETLGGEKRIGYLDPHKRNIKALRLRGEKSDGILTRYESLYKVLSEKWVNNNVKVGDSFDALKGVVICEKYIPKKDVVKNNITPTSKGKVRAKDVFPLFQRHTDTKQLMYNLESFREGDLVTITLKMHGTSQRTSFTVKHREDSTLEKVSKKLFGLSKPKTWELITGTRRVVLDSYDGGYYGDNSFRKNHHERFEGKLNKGETVFYEVVGYTDTGKPIMPNSNNLKMNDKDFVKKYGEETEFSYGCNPGESEIYIYRMTMQNEDGHIVEYPTWFTKIRAEQMGVNHVPVFDTFFFSTQEDLMNRVERFEGGADPIGKTHIREGVIVRIENRDKFDAYKQKNFEFKVLEGIIKEDADEPDMEEAQDFVEEIV